MIITKTQICNMAIGKLGGQLLTDYDTDTTPVAGLCRLWYPVSLKTLLEDMPYTFATDRTELTVHMVDGPLYEFTYRYQLPGDFIQIVDTDPPEARWKIEGTKLLSDESSLGIRYVYALENTAQMSGHFVTCLSCLLAVNLCLPITRNVKYVSVMENQYEKILLTSRGRDSQQESRQTYEADTLVSVRL